MNKLKIFAVAILTFSLVFTSCQKSFFGIYGEGDIIEKTLELDDLNEIINIGAIDIVISQGDTQKVVAVGHGNIIDRLETAVQNDTWKVKLERGNYRNYELTIYITVVELENIVIIGSGDVSIGKFKNLSNLDIEITGSGDIVSDSLIGESIDINIIGSGNVDLITIANSLNSSITGSGDINISGETTNQTCDIIGSGDYNTFKLESDNCDIKIAGSGDAKINTQNSLDINIAGSGDIYYIGNPNINVNISGSGSVINMN